MQHVNNNGYKPSFYGKLQFTRRAGEILKEKVENLLLPGQKDKILEQYDTFIRKVVNSNFDVNVAELPEEQLVANVCMRGTEDVIAYSIHRNGILTKLGLENPIKFMLEALEKAKKNLKRKSE